MKKTDHIVRRYIMFLIGLFVASFGVALSTKAGLGTTPVASVSYCVALLLKFISFGGWIIAMGIAQVIVQIIVQKAKCNWIEIIIQLVLTFAYGYLTDFSAFLIRDLVVVSYPAKLFFLVLSSFILALGIWIQFKGGVAMLPGEAMNRAISQATGFRYENIKIATDVFYIVVSVLISFIFMGKLVGVREGSIIAAIIVGFFIKFDNWAFGKIVKK